MDKQREVFKMLWPDKCWHEDSGERGSGGYACLEELINPQLFLDALYDFGVETGRIR